MESLVKFLEDKITDKMSVEEIVDVFVYCSFFFSSADCVIL